MFKKAPRILFFIDGDLPSKKEYAAAARLGPNTSFRNAQYINEEGALETCDGVAGEVPKRYAEAYPTAEAALESYAKMLEDAAKAEDTDDGPELDFGGKAPAPAPSPVEPKQEAPAKPGKPPVAWTPNAGAPTETK
jgi:hypothetical protein